MLGTDADAGRRKAGVTVTETPVAFELIKQRSAWHGPLAFHQSAVLR